MENRTPFPALYFLLSTLNFLSSGGEGNRTPVRKVSCTSYYERSFILIVLRGCPETGISQSNPLYCFPKLARRKNKQGIRHNDTRPRPYRKRRLMRLSYIVRQQVLAEEKKLPQSTQSHLLLMHFVLHLCFATMFYEVR